ncbi:hypothetical protein M0R72_02725 [Candidatus Pacearchaeota archaeon]|jgi:hypothetical protein|nr:hypothetical protein [Candidatus Pacearchaeota archaeon]
MEEKKGESKRPVPKKVELPKPRQRFMIVVEGIVPVKVRFQTFATDEHEALKQLDNPHLLSMLERPELDMPRLIRKKITVKDANTSLVKLVKNF